MIRPISIKISFQNTKNEQLLKVALESLQFKLDDQEKYSKNLDTESCKTIEVNYSSIVSLTVKLLLETSGG